MPNYFSYYQGTQDATTAHTLASFGAAPAAGLAANQIYFTTETNNVRWRGDGVAPTATVGNLIKTTDPVFVFDARAAATVQIIGTAASATVNLTYVGA